MSTSVLDLFRLDGKVAIVTGASSGLGVAFASALAEAGADLVLAARRTDRLQETKAQIEERGRRALTVTADVAKVEDCQAVVDAAMAEFGHVDVLVNNAGKGTAYPATRETPEQFREVIDINLNGCYWMAQACGRVMQPGSSIVNISSINAFRSGDLPAGRVLVEQGGDRRPDARPRRPVDRAQGDPRQRDCARLLRVGDDRPVPRRVRRADHPGHPDGPHGRPAGARRGARVPRQPRGRLRHLDDATGRRGGHGLLGADHGRRDVLVDAQQVARVVGRLGRL